MTLFNLVNNDLRERRHTWLARAINMHEHCADGTRTVRQHAQTRQRGDDGAMRRGRHRVDGGRRG